MVRGLDYYNHTVFEFTTSHLGSQNAVLSGGRYNNLIEQMGGPATPGVGWAAGMDRLALLLEKPKSAHQTVAVIAASDEAAEKALQVLNQLRQTKIPAQPIYTGNMSKQLKKANKRNCSHAIIIGEKELSSGQWMLKSLVAGDQNESSPEQALQTLKDFYQI